MRPLFTILCLTFLLFSCTEERYFEDNHDFDNRIWTMDETAEFNFEIDSLELPYQIKLNIRNTIDYPYRNLYIQYRLQDSTSLIEENLVNVNLFEAKSGQPYGTHQSDIYSHQLVLQDSVFFNEKGNYKIELKQYMRENELEGIVSSGIRIEQIKE